MSTADNNLLAQCFQGDFDGMRSRSTHKPPEATKEEISNYEKLTKMSVDELLLMTRNGDLVPPFIISMAYERESKGTAVRSKQPTDGVHNGKK